jgi:hypothetical protein
MVARAEPSNGDTRARRLIGDSPAKRDIADRVDVRALVTRGEGAAARRQYRYPYDQKLKPQLLFDDHWTANSCHKAAAHLRWRDRLEGSAAPVINQ